MSSMKTSSIKAVLFDFGGVFTDSPFTAVQKFGAGIGLPEGEIMELVFGSYARDGDHPWHKLERGEISLESTREHILTAGRERGVDVDIYALFAKIAENSGGSDIREPLVKKVQMLKNEDYRLGIVTNNVKEFADGWRSLLSVPVDDLFEFVVDSSDVGVRKPDPEIFHLAAAKLPGVELQEMLFLDDYQANLNAASKLGMQTILVGEDPLQTVRDLDRRLSSC
jgi:putative hydrolase of the HAD superfamily